MAGPVVPGVAPMAPWVEVGPPVWMDRAKLR